jgi:signal transduction histidine kinase
MPDRVALAVSEASSMVERVVWNTQDGLRRPWDLSHFFHKSTDWACSGVHTIEGRFPPVAGHLEGASMGASDPLVRRSTIDQGLIPAAVILLLGVVAGLTYHARAADRSHRATAERALEEYAAFATWQYDRHAASRIEDRLRTVLAPARELGRRFRSDMMLPGASLLSADSSRCSCGFGPDIRFGFRITLPERELTIDREIAAPVHASIARWIDRADAAARDSLAANPRESEAVKWARLDLDTLGGKPQAIAWTIVRDEHRVARAAYGIVAEPRTIVMLLKCASETEPLLPPALTTAAPNDSLLRIRVTRPDGVVLFASGGELTGTYAATDTLSSAAGRLVTTIELKPRTASALLTGGMPPSRLPVQFALLGAAVLIAGIALVQLRRTRELARLRSQFVANVSHELRTPLTQISMFSETLLLSRERSREEREHFLGVIFREARRLTTLVDSVLRFSRGEAGMARVRPEPRDLSADVQDTLHTFGPLAAAADVHLATEISDGAWAMADSGAVRQIVLNLLDNAVKYGPRGQTVTVGVDSSDEQVVVWVEDEGAGIPPNERLRAFEPFTRLERAGVARVSGAGIGLAVVHDLVRAHRGRVWIEDGRTSGARVSFAIPAAPEVAPVHEAVGEPVLAAAR